METCRLCCESKSKKDASRIDDKKLGIAKKLQEAFNINFSSSRSTSPGFCCKICFMKLNSSHSFYKKIVESQKKFENKNLNIETIVLKQEKSDERNAIKFFGSDEEQNMDENGSDYGDENEDDRPLKFLKLGHGSRCASSNLNELSNLYNEFESDQVNTALYEMGFDCIKGLFRKEKIDFQTFLNLNQIDFYEILKEYPIGIRSKVFSCYEIWRSGLSDAPSLNDPLNPISTQRMNSTNQQISKKLSNENNIIPSKSNQQKKVTPKNFVASNRTFILPFEEPDNRYVTIFDLRILQENFSRQLKKSENKKSIEVHEEHELQQADTLECEDPVSPKIEPMDESPQRCVRESTPAEELIKTVNFPLKTWRELLAFSVRIEQDENFRHTKIKELRPYTVIERNTDEKNKKKIFRSFLRMITTIETRLEGNFAGRRGSGEVTKKVPESFLMFTKECFKWNQTMSMVKIEEHIRKAWNQTIDTVRKKKGKSMIDFEFL